MKLKILLVQSDPPGLHGHAAKLQHYGLCILKPKGLRQKAGAGSCSTSCKHHMPKTSESHSLPLRGSTGRNNSGQTDSLALCFVHDLYKASLHDCQSITGHWKAFFSITISFCRIWLRRIYISSTVTRSHSPGYTCTPKPQTLWFWWRKTVCNLEIGLWAHKQAQHTQLTFSQFFAGSPFPLSISAPK